MRSCRDRLMAGERPTSLLGLLELFGREDGQPGLKGQVGSGPMIEVERIGFVMKTLGLS